ncbi:hybrid sensor histidine kinase/response regulator [Polaromonas sp.]|uniref:hybrid sensor histidine kinase/response regulator n=1 Tax=Polaromonas sp. TaxID=1869339 RepID=UPI002FC77D28
MSTKEDKFLQQLRATFKVEAEEHLQAIAAGLLELEKTSSAKAQGQVVETVFRAAHSLKGAARAVDFTEIELLCQSMEDVFASWKRQENVPSSDALDTLHRALDAVTGALAAPAGSAAQPALSLLRQALRPFASASSSAHQEPAAADPPAIELAATASPVATGKMPPQDTVRVAVSKLEARLLEAEEMLTAKLTADQRVADLRELSGRFDAWRNAWAEVEPQARQLRQQPAQPAAGLARLLDFFDWSLDYVRAVESKAVALERTAQHDRHAIGKLVDDLLEDSKKLLLLPFATISASFPKLVRDLCRDQGKEADLTVHGEDIEIDKRILEELKDPLVHLLRNSVDHGIETPQSRTQLGKPARATITLAVSQVSGSKVEISVSDDGAGVDTAKVKESAIKQGLVSADEARQLDDAQAQTLIFQAEVSTSAMITRLSGRGLGLAIVREKVAKLGGTVTVESQPHRGSCFRMVLPAVLATFRGILIEAEGRLFVVPTFHVERVARVKADEVQAVEGRETIALGGRAMALVRLAEVLELPLVPRNGEPPADTLVVVLGVADQRVAFAVDAVLDEQEVLVKRLDKPLARVRNIAGATVLGSGQVAPILNVADLLKSARKAGGVALRVAAGAKPVEAGTVLVAEDSITSRMLLRSILESAGYKVKTAVDGMEALTLLRTEKFELLVSDVEMPRLNGFDLTQRIRADKKLAELPVVLVTALETREDRERGVDVGAHAYLVKSSFDQSNLLEVVRRLI